MRPRIEPLSSAARRLRASRCLLCFFFCFIMVSAFVRTLLACQDQMYSMYVCISSLDLAYLENASRSSI